MTGASWVVRLTDKKLTLQTSLSQMHTGFFSKINWDAVLNSKAT